MSELCRSVTRGVVVSYVNRAGTKLNSQCDYVGGVSLIPPTYVGW